ncbi:MAG: GNAT family N-acetyltransferase [Oscillospiraceae bacterium]|nr:GNAT family N-acetyltransferase [Oscillospiraceae bacterium]
MSDFIIRGYKKADIPELTKLWVQVFEEDERLLDAFFVSLEHMGGGLVAEIDGKIAGAGYALTGQSLVSGGEITPLGLIYGIAVYPQYRSHGLGRTIVRGTAELARQRGAEIICCEPANQSLVKWYDEVLSLKPAIRRAEKDIPGKAALPCRPVSADEYGEIRKKLLSGREYVALSKPALDFEAAMLKIYGGGFFSVGEGIAAAYLWEGKTIVRELLCAEADKEAAAASLAFALSSDGAVLYFPSEMGQAYILSDSPIPSHCLWNLSFN